MAKPEFLYHASKNKNILEFEPRNESVRDPNEGPVIFATPHIEYASCFIFPSDDTWASIGSFGEELPWYVVYNMPIEKFKEQDQGGAIYQFSNENFSYDAEKNMADWEWISRVNTKPIGKRVYESSLDAMLENNVAVYFVDDLVWNAILESDNFGFSIIKKLKPVTRQLATSNS